MSEPITQTTPTPAPTPAPVPSVLDTVLAETANPQPDEQEAGETDAAAEQDERKLNALLRKAEAAFCKGNKSLLLSRVECGKWCHEIYVLRQEQGYKDRGFTKTLIFNRLAVHADHKRECDGDEMALLYKTVEMLEKASNWKALTIGKVAELSKLVSRVEGTELYSVFDLAKTEQCKELFAWACGEGLKRPSIADIAAKVLELKDPKKYAEKQKEQEAKQAAKPEDAAAEDADEKEEDTPAPENLIKTDAARPAAPDWKDVPDGMVALYKEGTKQQPGHQADMMRDFAKQFVWTDAMVKGLIDGIANSKDAESAQQAMQMMVNVIGEEYSLYPDSEYSAEAEAA